MPIHGPDHAGSSGPVWILEGEIFNAAGEVVRRVAISDGLDQIRTDLNGVAGFVLDDAGCRLSNELVAQNRRCRLVGVDDRLQLALV